MRRIKKSIKIFKKEGISGLYVAFKRYLYRIISRYPLIHYFDDLLIKLGKRYVVRDILGNKILLDLSDRGLCRDLYHNGIREPESSKIYQEFIKGEKNVLDIGTNIGYFVLLASKVINGKIYALEPDPRSFNLLKKNIEINNLNDRIEIYNIAAGDKKGKVNFYQEESLNLSRVAKKDEDGLKSDMTTIDDFLCGKEVSCLRFDVEGYEYFLFKGAEKTLQKKGLKIFMEIHPSLIKEYGGSLSGVFAMLKDFRVKYYVIPKKQFVEKPPLLPLFAILFAGKRVVPCEVLNINKTIAEILGDKEMKTLLMEEGAYHLFLERN